MEWLDGAMPIGPGPARQEKGTQMASERQIEANRTNAKRSTGPKTAAGKAKSSGNALRHGLASRGAVEKQSYEGLVAELMFTEDVPLDKERAANLLRSSFEFSRVRNVRFEMLAALLKCQTPERLQILKNLERYERVAWARQKRSLRSLQSEKVR